MLFSILWASFFIVTCCLLIYILKSHFYDHFISSPILRIYENLILTEWNLFHFYKHLNIQNENYKLFVVNSISKSTYFWIYFRGGKITGNSFLKGMKFFALIYQIDFQTEIYLAKKYIYILWGAKIFKNLINKCNSSWISRRFSSL